VPRGITSTSLKSEDKQKNLKRQTTRKCVKNLKTWGGMTHTLENTTKKKIHVRKIVCEYICVKICANGVRELAERAEHHEKWK